MNILAHSGSDAEFDEFDLAYVGTASGTDGAGYGLYFSESKADALGYGNNVYTCMLQLQNNVSNIDITFQPHIIKAILDKVESTYGKSFFNGTKSDEEKNIIVSTLLDKNSCDTDIIAEIIDTLFAGKCKQFLQILSKYGFTHTVDNETPEDKTITHYIVYDVNAITIQEKFKL